MKKKYIDLKNYLYKFSINIESNLPDITTIAGISSIDDSNNFQITFFNDIKYKNKLANTSALACFIIDKHKSLLPTNCIPLVVSNPYECFAHSTNFFYSNFFSNGIINKKSLVSKNAKLGLNTQINFNASINENSIIGDDVIIFDNVYIGPNVKIGSNTVIQPNCVITNSEIGKNCLIESGTIIGDKGFGFTQDTKVMIQHVGNVLIGDNVQIGSNVTIDRASLISTKIEDNVRIDNLVHIAHSVCIKNNTIIAAQVGIAGSTTIGKNCIIGGQAGIAGHLIIGDDVIIAAKSGVTKNINNKSIVAGFPATSIMKWKKNIINQYKGIK